MEDLPESYLPEVGFEFLRFEETQPRFTHCRGSAAKVVTRERSSPASVSSSRPCREALSLPLN